MKNNTIQKNIPDGWQEVKLGEVARIFDGTHQTPEYTESGVPFYSVEHVTADDFSDTKYISEEIFKKESERVSIEKGDILMTRIGDVGTARHIDWNARASFYVSLALIKCKKTVDPKFLTFFINSSHFQKEIWGKTIHVAFPNKINLGDISKCLIILPPLSEQNKIADILDAWEQVINKLAERIKTKKNIRKGLMQNLLSGKKRLAKFSDKWSVVKLGDICDIKTGDKNNQDKIKDGKYPFFVRSQNIERINTYSYDGEAILVPGEGNVGKIFHYINGKFDYHQRVYKMSSFKKNAFGRYIHYYFTQNFSRQTKSHSVKATVDSLRLPTFKKFKINLPPIEEQKCIVDILLMADIEIEKLEEKLKILKDQKRYLLNNLITGTIRTKA